MKIYVDLILILNFTFDFLLLLVVNIILRRNIPLYKIMIGAFIGSLSILFLFFKMSTFTLFILKIVISLIMILITFGYHNLKYLFRNLLYLYTASMILGGFLYFLNVEFSYKQTGLVFYHNGLSINFIFLIIFSPIILYIYIKQAIKLKNTYSNYYQISLFVKSKKLNLIGYLDTGLTLVDPIKKRPVLLVSKKDLKLDVSDLKTFYIPYQTINEKNILKAIIVDKVEIKGIGIKENVVVGIIEEEIKIDGINCILPEKLLEG